MQGPTNLPTEFKTSPVPHAPRADTLFQAFVYEGYFILPPPTAVRDPGGMRAITARTHCHNGSGIVPQDLPFSVQGTLLPFLPGLNQECPPWQECPAERGIEGGSGLFDSVVFDLAVEGAQADAEDLRRLRLVPPGFGEGVPDGVPLDLGEGAGGGAGPRAVGGRPPCATSGGRSPGSIAFPCATRVAVSSALRSCRTLPGHRYASRLFNAAGQGRAGGTPVSFPRPSRKRTH